MEKEAKKHINGVMPQWVYLRIAGYFVFISAALLFGGLSTARAADSNSPVKILWQKEFAPDANLDYSLGGTELSKDNDGLTVIGKSFREMPGERYPTVTNLKFWLWQITPDGRISKNIIFKDFTEEENNPSMRFRSYEMAIGQSIMDFTLGNDESIYTVFRSHVRVTSILKADMEGKNISVKPLAKEDEKFLSIRAVKACPDNNLLLFADISYNPIVIKLDSELNRVWRKDYDIGGRADEAFMTVLPAYGKDSFVISGLATNDSYSEMSLEELRDGFVLLLDKDGNILQKARFAALPWSQHKDSPRTCQLDSGIIVVANDLAYEDEELNIVITAYTPDLELLWEKRMNKPLKPYTTFWMQHISGNRFIIMTAYRYWSHSDYRPEAAKTDNTLGLYIFDSNGTASGSAVIDKGDFSPRMLESTKNILYIIGSVPPHRIKIMALQIN